MCGIAGFVDKTGCMKNEVLSKKGKNIEKIKREMLDSMITRGPDSEGQIEVNNVTLLHRRLAVIDIENGKQPMTIKYKGNTYHIVYNGELYNTDEVRNMLKEEGHTFKTNSDTEVLLRAFIEKGEKALDLLNGIFAFAVYNENERSLFIARDRMGVKPLFFYEDEDIFIFASQIKTILKTGKVKREIDIEGFNEIFMLGPGRTPGCGVFKGIKELKRGECGLYEFGNFTYHKYWDVKANKFDMSLEETIERTRYLVKDSIERQLVSDVKIGTFLSGGLDSSLISKIAADYFKANNKEPLSTYSVNYVDNKKFFEKSVFQPNSDEEYIEIMKKYINSNHKEVVLDSNDVAEALYDATFTRDLPGMVDIDSSLLLFAKEVKKDYSVMLSGESADEIFGGYPWYTNKEVLYRETFPWAQTLELRKNILNKEIYNKLNGEEYLRERYENEIKNVDKLDGESKEETRMREMFMLNINWFMQTLLDRKDRMTMGCGLEVRVPFCDYRIVEFAYNMPLEYKFFDGREKGILRKAFEDYLPYDIVWRKKSPYPKTHNPVYFENVKNKVLNILEDKNSFLSNVIDKNELLKMIELKDEMKLTWYGQLMKVPQILAYLYQIEMWVKMFDVKVKI